MTVQELEQAKVQEIAAEYRSKGYAVRIHPRSEDLPPFLASHQVDLVAQSPDDNVAVEIGSARSARSEDWVQVAEAVRSQPNWRFEVVVVNPTSAPDVPVHGELAGAEQIQSSLKNAEILRNEGQFEAAALLAWSAAEAILRAWARTEGLGLERRSSSSLLKNVYSAGLIEPSSYARLQELLEFRNAFAHGFRAQLDQHQLTELIGEVARLRTAA